MRQISYIEQRRVLQNPFAAKAQAERIVNNIGRATRKHYCAEDKIRILLDGLRGENIIALARQYGRYGYRRAKAMMSSLKACSSSAPLGTLRCVDRCWPRTRQILRSDIASSLRT